MNNPPTRKGRVIKINYATQSFGCTTKNLFYSVTTRTYTFLSYARYIENKFRESFGFDGSPIMISLKLRARIYKYGIVKNSSLLK